MSMREETHRMRIDASETVDEGAIVEGADEYLETLRGLARQGDTYITFSSVPAKVGIYPINLYDTPTGVYGYILTPILVRDLELALAWAKSEANPGDKLTDGQLKRLGARQLASFALDRPWLHTYTLKRDRLRNADGTSGIVRLGPDGRSGQYTHHRFNKDLAWTTETLRELGIDNSQAVRWPIKWATEARNSKAFGRIWNVTRKLAQFWAQKKSIKPTTAWNVILRKIGVLSVADYGSSIIHEAEAFQSVTMDGTVVKVITSGINPILPRGTGRGVKKKLAIGSPEKMLSIVKSKGLPPAKATTDPSAVVKAITSFTASPLVHAAHKQVVSSLKGKFGDVLSISNGVAPWIANLWTAGNFGIFLGRIALASTEFTKLKYPKQLLIPGADKVLVPIKEVEVVFGRIVIDRNTGKVLKLMTVEVIVTTKAGKTYNDLDGVDEMATDTLDAMDGLDVIEPALIEGVRNAIRNHILGMADKYLGRIKATAGK